VSVEAPPVDEANGIIAAGDRSAPVFVDTTGRRGRRIRFVFNVVGAAALTYTALVAVSLVGGPLDPQQLLPLPEPAQPPSVTAPGRKNTPSANRSSSTGKRPAGGRPARSRAAPGASVAVPSGSATAATTPATTPAPPAEATSAAPSASLSPAPTETRQPTALPSTEPPAPQPSGLGTAGTVHSAIAVVFGEAAIARPDLSSSIMAVVVGSA
jgi:hypothetical protein